MQEPEGGEGSARVGEWMAGGEHANTSGICETLQTLITSREKCTGRIRRGAERKSAVFPSAITEAAEVTPTRRCANQPPKFKKRLIKQETGGEREKKNKTKQFSIWWDITSKLAAIVRCVTAAKKQKAG